MLTLLDEIHLVYINEGIYYNMLSFFSIYIEDTIKQFLDGTNMLLLNLLLMSSVFLLHMEFWIIGICWSTASKTNIRLDIGYLVTKIKMKINGI
jgi:hypothetical protein